MQTSELTPENKWEMTPVNNLTKVQNNMPTNLKMPLSVYVLFHSNYNQGIDVYTSIYHLLCRNAEQPLTDGVDIPVFLRTGSQDQSIPEIDFEQSDKTAIILLVDESMYCCSKWKIYIDYLVSSTKTNENIKLYPVALFKYAFAIDNALSKNQFITLKTHSIIDNWNEFQLRIFDNLIRLIRNQGTTKLKLFISHSKNDTPIKTGELKAEELKYYLRVDTKLDSFFDANDIADGYDFGKQIEQNVKESLMIILESNSYSEREWCRIEALSGKINKVPTVVVNLIDGIVKRTFPYIGNVPRIRYDNNWNEIVNLLLRTALNQYYQEQLLDKINTQIVSSSYTILPVSPELLSFHLIKGAKKVLYPEPPLGSEEINFLKLYEDKIEFRTPIQALSETAFNLKNKQIAISISESEDIVSFGGGDALLRDITIEISRHILIAGAKLVYGGDLRSQGFTELFKDLSCQYGQLEKSDNTTKYFTNYFAWPISLNLTESQKAEFKFCRVNTEIVEAPSECLPNKTHEFLRPTTPENNYLWAKSLTKMREQMESNVHARILLGGRISGFKGKYPGIIEEFIISKNHNHPIFLLGGFGGASKVIVDIIEGEDGSNLKKQTQKDCSYKELIEYYNSQDRTNPIDYDEIIALIKEDGIMGLNNGLDEYENKILFHSTNVLEIVAIVLKGLNSKL